MKITDIYPVHNPQQFPEFLDAFNRTFDVELNNGELICTDRDGNVFTYSTNDTLFHGHVSDTCILDSSNQEIIYINMEEHVIGLPSQESIKDIPEAINQFYPHACCRCKESMTYFSETNYLPCCGNYICSIHKHSHQCRVME